MTVTIAYLGPEGTYSQIAALAYSLELERKNGDAVELVSLPSIPQAMKSTANGATALTIVPVENSTEGGVTATLDTLWQLRQLYIHHAVVMPIRHGLLSHAHDIESIEAVYSHPQALSQCQSWLGTNLPQANLVATKSTTEALSYLSNNQHVAAIAAEWAAQLYSLPILARGINDSVDNCTKFWVLSHQNNAVDPIGTEYTSIAFSLPINGPGALLKPLAVLAKYGINLSRIESRPTKRSLGDYLFFIDLEINASSAVGKQAMEDLLTCTETLVNFGTYDLSPIDPHLAVAKAKLELIQAPL
ncbi:MAG TPA: prephenate dehydratase [Nodosilinea sp.]|nr:prephenate dehydratase [Nodosilinea sp.]